MSEDAPLSLALLTQDPADHDPIRARWLLALGLLACGATLFLIEALYAAMDHDAHFAVAPALFQWDSVARAGVDGLRGNRLDPDRPSSEATRDQVRIEQLNSSGLSMRPFTHVVAYLAYIPTAPAAEPVARTEAAAPAAAGSQAEVPQGDSSQAGGSAVSPYGSVKTASAAAGSAEPPPLGEPVNVTPVPESPPGRQAVRRLIVARKGDSLAAIVQALGASAGQAQGIGSLYAAGGAGAAFAGGEKISVLQNRAPKGSPSAPLEVRVERDGAPPWAVALADDGGYAPIAAAARSQKEAAPPDLGADPGDDLREGVDESVQDSLDALVQSRGVDQLLVDQIVRLCAHDFDLAAPVAASDRIEFLYTPGDLDEPELRFVRLTAEGETREYYRFTAPDDGSVDYYDKDGRSVTKFLLRRPTPGGRLNDGFGWRIHPILKDRRFHEGVDYDAPMGAPIEAAGAGVVEKISEESGYGKYIRIRHDLGYETTYAHVSGFARGIKVGSRVRQGQVIAYVGSTGLSTGPHLYYEVRINGHNVDPLKIRLASGRVLAGAVLVDFESRRERTDELVSASAIAQNAPERRDVSD